VAVGEPVEANDADGDTLTYSLDGDDASSFNIDTGSGQIRVAADAMLDFETKPLYSVTVSVTDNKDSEGNADPTVDGVVVVTINVNNVDDDGSVTVTAGTPTAGTALTATLSDPDGSVMSVTWQWQRTSLIMADIWEDITGAESDSYTPTAHEIGRFLRAVASYTDGEGSGKTATSGATPSRRRRERPPSPIAWCRGALTRTPLVEWPWESRSKPTMPTATRSRIRWMAMMRRRSILTRARARSASPQQRIWTSR
jgi:hypothetical protein